MSDTSGPLPAQPAPPYYGGYVQPTPGSAPIPAPVPAPRYVTTPSAGPGPAPAPARPGVLGAVALVLALVAVVVASALSSITGFAAAEGAMRHAVGMSPQGLENLSEQQLLGLLSPVRDLVLWAEIGFWLGTVLGLAALATGITAIATRRGRGPGIAAVVIAGAGAFVYSAAVGVFLFAGMATGAA